MNERPSKQRLKDEKRRGTGRGVIRIDIHSPKHTHGWQARVYQGRQALTRFFSDSKHGGRDGAFQAAAAAREMMEMGRQGTEKSREQASCMT